MTLYVNFSFINKVLWAPQSNILTIASLDISSKKGLLLLLLIFVPLVSRLCHLLEKWAKIYLKILNNSLLNLSLLPI